MNKSVKLNCKKFQCNFNNKGQCKLSSITLSDDGSPFVDRLICVDAEPKPEKDKLLEALIIERQEG